MSFNFNSLWLDWRAKVPDGTPNPSNAYHLVLLKELCFKQGIDKDIIDNVILVLEKEGDGLDDKEKEKAKSKGLVSKGYGNWGPEDGDTTHKNVDGKLTPIGDDDEEEKEPTKQMKIDANPFDKEDDEGKEGGKVDSKLEKKNEQREKDNKLVDTQLRLKKGDEQDKGGAGTPESRTGETVTVWSGKKVQQLMSDGKSYEEARKEVREELLEITKEKDSLLTKEWVEAGLNCLDWIENNYGLDNIEEIAWDTPEGNSLIGSTGHGTSADMFVKTKEGKKVGVSLKKDFKVFIVNGGYGKKIGEVAEMLGIDPKDLPDNVKPEHYKNRRGEVLDQGIPKLNEPKTKQIIKEKFEEVLNNEEVAYKVFGKAWKKRLNYIAARKTNLSLGAFNKLSPQEQQKLLDELTSDDLHDHVINAKPLIGEDIKVIANIANINEVNEITNLYTDLRKLDEEVADNLMEFLNDGENLNKFKELVAKETHIDDILFGSEGALDKLEVLYGEKGGVSMSPESVSNLFNIGDLYEQYKKADGEEKEELKKQIQEKVKEKMVITRDQGKPVIAVKVMVPDPPPDGPSKESTLPIFGLATRTKGIGNSNGLEMSQSAFGSLAFKNGNVDIDSWPPEDKTKVVNDQIKSVLNDIEDNNINLNTDEGMAQLQEKIKLLERWDPKNKSLKKLKDRYDL